MYLTPIPKQFVDYSGVPLSNGTISVYDAGTTDFANIYQDAEGTQLLNNPARLDSYGMWKCFVPGNIPLDYVVKDGNDNVIATYENLVPGSGSGSDSVLRIINKDSANFNFSNISGLLSNGNDVVILVTGSSGAVYFTLSSEASSSIVFSSLEDGRYSVLTLNSDDTSTLDIRTIANDVNVFVAEYHVTPFADIKAAYDSGAYVVLKMGPPYLNLTSITETEVQFGSVYKYPSGTLYDSATYSFFAKVNNNDEWENSNVPILVPADGSIDYNFSSGSIKTRMQSTVAKGDFNSLEWFRVAELVPITGSHIDNWISLKVTFESYCDVGSAGVKKILTQALELGMHTWTVDSDPSHVRYEAEGHLNHDPATTEGLQEVDECLVCVRDGFMEIWAHVKNRTIHQGIFVASASVNEMYTLRASDLYDMGVTRQPWKFMGGVRFGNLPSGTYYEIIHFYASEKYDTVLSDSSKNAVQNEVLYREIGRVKDGGALTQAASITVDNNAHHTMNVTNQNSITITVLVEDGHVPNLTIDIDTSGSPTDVDVNVQKDVGGVITQLNRAFYSEPILYGDGKSVWRLQCLGDYYNVKKIGDVNLQTMTGP